MRWCYAVSLLGVAMICSGCSTHKFASQGSLYMAIKATVVRESGPAPAYRYVNLDEVTVSKRSTAKSLKSRERIETKHIIKLEIDQTQAGEDRHYYALVGPKVPGGIAEATIETSAATLYLSSGWVFAWGRWPALRTNYVRIGAESTSIIAEYDAGLERVYFLKEATTDPTERVHVECIDGSDTASLPPDHYVEIGSGCVIGVPIPISASIVPPATTAFVAECRAAALVSGWAP